MILRAEYLVLASYVSSKLRVEFQGPHGTVTKNEILYSLNKPNEFILAIVEFMPDGGHGVHYLHRPFQREPDFGVTSV